MTFKPVSGSEKKFDARTDKKSGDSPNNAILAPEAIPRYFGNAFDAAKSEENNLQRQKHQSYGRGCTRRLYTRGHSPKASQEEKERQVMKGC